MFFRKKKAAPVPQTTRAEPEAPVSPGAASPSTAFLTGDHGFDQRTLDKLLGAIARVSEARELDELLSNIVDTSIEITQAERGFLILLGEAGEIDVRVARQRGQQSVKGEVRYSTSIVKRVLADREPLRATVSSDSEALELGTSVFDLKLRAVMCVPLIADAAGSPVERGVLYVDSKVATREFSPKDLALFNTLSLYIRIALQNNKLHIASLEKARLERSLDIASQIQRDLMPDMPKDVPGFDVHGWYQPAEHTTGDFLETLSLANGRLAFALGDVTGKGIGPALIMENAKGALRTYLRLLDDPAQIVSSLNTDLAPRMDNGRFLTLVLAVFDPEGRVRAVNAGHTPPIIWRAKTGVLETIDGHGPALGMADDFTYESETPRVLEKGDVLIAYTDGFDEARSMSAEAHLFGEDGVREALVKAASGGAGAKDIVQHIVRSVLEFTGGKRYDDMALVVVRRTQ
ncbi:MAG: GAF domain-containing SpoIIE family protein phosphatase [Planctomycetota bacterium]|nr:GAF domain-containing SpoIIE family protein phosphatase [Planctomycetota bacterium]